MYIYVLRLFSGKIHSFRMENGFLTNFPLLRTGSAECVTASFLEKSRPWPNCALRWSQAMKSTGKMTVP
jgi:hypothetical protein